MKTAPRKWNGMNWITQTRRLAIYLRDGCACVYCSASVENGTQLTLDHLKPHIKGGANESDNLVTACKRCNTSRGTRSVKAFTEVVAAYLDHGVTADTILAHVRRCQKRAMTKYIAEAKELIARRGSVAAVFAATE